MTDRTLSRWRQQRVPNQSLHVLQHKFRFYKSNIYILNHATLKIQHWFFEHLNRKQRRAPSLQIKLSDSLIYNPVGQKSRTTLTKAKQPSNDIESVDVSIDETENIADFVIAPKFASRKEVCRSGYNSTTSTCSSKVMQEDLLNALKIKKNVRTRSGASPSTKWQATTSVYSKSRIGKENLAVKSSPLNKIPVKEQQIVDACWNKLLNQADGGYCSGFMSPARGFRSPKVSYTRAKSPECSKVAPIVTTKAQIRKGVVEILTTKARKDARSLSPLAERIKLPESSPVQRPINITKTKTSEEKKLEQQKKQRRRRDERMKQKEQTVVFDLVKYATARNQPKVAPFVLPKPGFRQVQPKRIVLTLNEG